MSQVPVDTAPCLEITDLCVSFDTEDGRAVAVENFSLRLDDSETVGLVGESGSGKSVTAMAVLGILPASAHVTGSIRFRGRELLGMRESDLRQLRGNEISLVFQDALSSLNPVVKIGEQLAEAVRVHDSSLSRRELTDRAVELLDLVGISSPRDRLDSYSHEFSGGMRQRVLIAMSLANNPAILIADEPTTALDVTVQAQILEVFERVQKRTNAAILFITHDLGVLARLADRVAVMYAGLNLEDGPAVEIFHETAHPYTRGLLASLPSLARRESRQSRLYRIPGQLPGPSNRPSGCVFLPRCADARPGVCDVARPVPVPVGESHSVACFRVDEIGHRS